METSLWRNPKKAVVVAEVAMEDLLLREITSSPNISRRKIKVATRKVRQPCSSQALSRTGTPAVATISRPTKD